MYLVIASIVKATTIIKKLAKIALAIVDTFCFALY